MARLAYIVIASYLCYTIVVMATDYCSPNLCSGGRTHIGCGNNGTFSSDCPNGTEMVPMTESLKEEILDNHNSKRNTIASGNLTGFEPATRMKMMQWDDELQTLAELNAKRCLFKHDSCRNTNAHRYSGQNLAKVWWKGGNRSYETLMMTRIDTWWLEFKDTDMSDINAYPRVTPKMIGHFTVMTAENNTHVGCACMKCPDNGWSSLTLVCNYAATNMLHQRMYKSGETASDCTNGTSSTYPSLCL